MKDRGLTTLRFLLGAAGVLLIAILAYRQYDRLTSQEAWVAAGDLAAGSVVGRTALRRARVDHAFGAVQDPRAILGNRLLADKKVGEPFFPADLQRPPKQWLNEFVPEGRVLYNLKQREFLLPADELRQGDRLDVLAIRDTRARLVAKNAIMVGTLRPPGQRRAKPQGLAALASAKNVPQSAPAAALPTFVLGVMPEEIFPLTEIGLSERIALVLHGKWEQEKGVLVDIEPGSSYHQIELIAGTERTNVQVAH